MSLTRRSFLVSSSAGLALAAWRAHASARPRTNQHLQRAAERLRPATRQTKLT